jgi:hypothetical protein
MIARGAQLERQASKLPLGRLSFLTKRFKGTLTKTSGMAAKYGGIGLGTTIGAIEAGGEAYHGNYRGASSTIGSTAGSILVGATVGAALGTTPAGWVVTAGVLAGGTVGGFGGGWAGGQAYDYFNQP